MFPLNAKLFSDYSFQFISSSSCSFSWTVILTGILIASFGTSFSLRVCHSVTWNAYASACCYPESDFGIGTYRARGMNSGCGIGIVTVLNLKVKVCVTRNALRTEERKGKLGWSLTRLGGNCAGSETLTSKTYTQQAGR